MRGENRRALAVTYIRGSGNVPLSGRGMGDQTVQLQESETSALYYIRGETDIPLY
jgi:hypothetical protein